MLINDMLISNILAVICLEMFSERRILIKNGVKSTYSIHYEIYVTIRRKMGRDIDSACGQLRCRQTDSLGTLEETTGD